MRHMHRYGMTREQLAQVSLNANRNALRNPRASAITKKPLTMDDYMAARMITSSPTRPRNCVVMAGRPSA